MLPAILPPDGASTPRRSPIPWSAIVRRALAILLAALLALLVLQAYRQPGFLIDFANLGLC